MRNSIIHAIESQSVFGNRKPNLIVIDEIDGAVGGSSDGSLIKFLVDLVNRDHNQNNKNQENEEETVKTKTKKQKQLMRPIICICNDAYIPALRPLRAVAQIYNIRQTTPQELSRHLKGICDLQQLKIEMRALNLLCEKADCDVRTCLNTLQFLQTSTATTMTNSNSSKTSSSNRITVERIKSTPIGTKDSQKSIFSLWEKIFYFPPSKAASSKL